MPTVSVIIPTYNRARFLRSAIASVLNQTFQDFEIIIVDDGSNDNTHSLVREFNDERIKYVRHEANGGEGKARNTGVVNSSAEYIAFLDDDDEWLPDKLQRQLNLLQAADSSVGGVYTGYVAIDVVDSRTVRICTPEKQGNVYEDLFAGNLIGGPSTVMLRMECFRKLGLFDETIPWGLDHDMWIRIAENYTFACIKEPLVRYYYHEDQMSNFTELRIKGKEAFLRKYAAYFSEHPKLHNCHLLEIGRLYSDREEYKKSRKMFRRAIKIYPYGLDGYRNMLKGLSLLIFGERNYLRIKQVKSILGFGFDGNRPKEPEGRSKYLRK
jgi:glycosyltransferase involved in cell wall biosynthesis